MLAQIGTRSRSSNSSSITMIVSVVFTSLLFLMSINGTPLVGNNDTRVHQRSVQAVATTKIVGGVRAAEHLSYGYSFGEGTCGGTLIHDDLFLTAAHCLGFFLDGILIGGTKFDGSDARLFVAVDYEIPHPAYSTITYVNDIMLVKLSSPVTSLPFQSLSTDVMKPRTHDVVKVMGYGLTSDGGSVSFFLREVNLDVASFAICDTLWGGTLEENIQFCTYTEGKDSCQGDSGGPLLDAFGQQVGLVSFGSGCAQPNTPAVNTRVGNYAAWIKSMICEHSDFGPASCVKAPANAPTKAPVRPPTNAPVRLPTRAPTKAPVLSGPVRPPTRKPTRKPSKAPTKAPVVSAPVRPPTRGPTKAPVLSAPVRPPSRKPTRKPSKAPTKAPVVSAPVRPPTRGPTKAPVLSAPVRPPSRKPTRKPSKAPTKAPVVSAPVRPPTGKPTRKPSKAPTKAPVVLAPVRPPTRAPTKAPVISAPVRPPTRKPTRKPTKAPVVSAPVRPPTRAPTKAPVRPPTRKPTRKPTKAPIVSAPVRPPTRAPTKTPVRPPTRKPTRKPSKAPIRA